MDALKVFIFSIFNPFKAFRIVKEKWGLKIYWFTAILVLLAIGIYSFISIPGVKEFPKDTQVEAPKKGKVSKPMDAERLILGQLKNFSNVGSFGNIMKYISSFLAPLGQIIDWFFIALIYWGLIFIFGSKTKYSKILSIIVISSVPILISNIVNIFYTLFTGKMIINPGLSGLVASRKVFADSSNILYMILSRVDIFILWGLILLIIGIAISCKMKVWKSISIVLIVLILSIIVVIATSSINRMFVGGIFLR